MGMQFRTPLRWLVTAIFLLALGAAGAGLFWSGEGQPYPFTSARGEAVMLAGRGLYRYDTVSLAAQEQANDLITLVLGLPLLAVSARLAWRGSLRGGLLLAGTLGFFLYTYLSMAMYAAYNPLFLVYVALLTLSLFAFVLCLMSFETAALPGRFSERLPRRAIATLLFAAGGFLLLAWLGRILPPLFQGQTPALENATTLVIQAMDLGLVAPASFLAGVLLLRRRPWGYLLAAVLLMKFLTMGAAVSSMGLNMLRVGVPVSPMELGFFPALTLANAVLAVLLLRSVRPINQLPPAEGTG